MRHPERGEVETPLIDQLEAMGWTHLPFAGPGQGRQTYSDVILVDRFRDAVHAINLGPDGRSWLDDERLTAIVNRTIREPEQGVQGNIAFTELLTGSELAVEGLPEWDDGLRQPVNLVDWEHPERNELLVVSQFRIDTFDGRRPYIVPDLVLFVNGLPFAVIECKDPGPTAVDEAIAQLQGYASDAPDLTRFAQLLVATDRETAQYGTITSPPEYFAAWRLVDPGVERVIRTEVGKPDGQPLYSQEILAGEMLRPATLLKLIRDFTVGQVVSGRQVKIVARWQQYRAVRRMVRRLAERQEAITATDAPDPRGGVTWHTQGSGKSLTMSFLVRVLRRHEELRGFKVVVVTDRLDLEEQILHSLGTTGETPRRAKSVVDARRHLANDTPDLVLVTIQKSRDEDDDDDVDESENDGIESALNDSNEIVVLVDEAHRSHSSWQHARLRRNLPNAVLIGFTGTPILKDRKKTTRDIFGPFLDVYALKDAEKDRAVVPIRYESREIPGAVIDQAILDQGFAASVPVDDAEREKLIHQFARHREVLEASDLISAKADDMLRYWVRNALPDRFSAQVVAVSRKAAVRYRDALLDARGRLLAEVDELSPAVLYDPMAWEEADERTQTLLEAAEHRELLTRITAAAVISKGNTAADSEWDQWTSSDRHRDHIRRFKDGLGDALELEPDPAWSGHGGALNHKHPIQAGGDEPWRRNTMDADLAPAGAMPPVEPIAFIVVKSMLLTGFDAPVEQILFVDRPIRKSAELLQAIARPNRPRKHKAFGLIVDYVGISADLARALNEYDTDHLDEIVGDADSRSLMMPLDEAVVPELQLQHKRVTNFLAQQGIRAVDTPAEREELLAQLDDPELRAEFDDVIKSFLTALNAVLPRPEALKYQGIARNLGIVQYLARRRYRDARTHFSPYRYGAKIRQLIDAHIRAEGTMPLSLAGDLEEVDLGWAVVEMAVVGGAFEAVVVSSVSFDHSGICSVPSWGIGSFGDFLGSFGERGGECFRGKSPPGW